MPDVPKDAPVHKFSSSLAAAAVGVVALVVVAGFAILLPKASGDSGDSGSSTAPTLPAKVGGFVALDSDAVPAALRQQIGGGSQVTQAQDQGRQGLEKVYGTPATYRFYVSGDAQSLLAVTVIDKEMGLFSPDGPPVQTTEGQQSTYQLSRVSGAVCAQYYSQQAGATGQPSGAAQLSRVHCQLGSDGRTYDVDARGLSAPKTVAVLKELAAA